MKKEIRKIEDWTVDELEKKRNQISFPEYQREKSLWAVEKKSMLIDSILNDIDIPKLYFNRLKNGEIEVIDGQQRLWSIWEFLDNTFQYQSNGKKSYFSGLASAQQRAIRDYIFQVTAFKEADEDYLRKLFVRLQLGLLLNTGERLHAETGKMKNFVFNTLAEHRFVRAIGIPARRFAKQTLCAQIAINSFARLKQETFSRTRYEDLTRLFKEYADPQGKDFDFFRNQTKSIVAVLDRLWECFGESSKELGNRMYILSIYLFMEDPGVPKAENKKFVEFIFRLWARLKEEAARGIDRKNRELYSFQSYLSSAPGEQYQIERRHEKLREYYEHYKLRGKIPGD
jgi:Protein of unknown function DUF262